MYINEISNMGASASVDYGNIDEKPKTPASPPKDDTFAKLNGTKYSFEVAYGMVEWVCKELEKFSTLRTNSVSPALVFLGQYTSCSTYGDEIAQMWASSLDKNNIVSIALKLWPSLWNPDFIKILSEEKDAEKVAEAEVTKSNFWYLCRIFWNGSDASKQICISLVDQGVIEELVKLLDREDFDPKTITKDRLRVYTMKAATGIMHNTMRLYHEETKSHFREANGVKVMQRYLDAHDSMVCTKAAVVLAYGVSEDEMDIINAKEDIIKYIIQRLLGPSINAQNHRVLGYSTEETIEALNALAANDENKFKMVQNGILKHYLTVTEKPLSEGELVAVSKGFWILSFKKENVKEMKKMRGCVEAIERLKSHENPRVSKSASGALWNISGRAPSATAGRRSSAGKEKRKGSGSMKSETKAGHVMISYDHQHKEVVRQLNNAIKQAGYLTWLDADRMSGSTLEAMAQAIEDAIVVLICMSDRYKNSPSCRTEAEYAYRLRKDIIPIRTEYKYMADGWLGILMGTKLYFDCYNNEQIPVCTDRVVKELGERGKIGSGHIAVKPIKEVKATFAYQGGPPKPQSPGYEKWSKDDVRKWLQENGLGHVAGKFGAFDGSLLVELKSMFQLSPTVFYQNARQDLGLTALTDTLKLTKAMNKLS